jgi:hypothetical protein
VTVHRFWQFSGLVGMCGRGRSVTSDVLARESAAAPTRWLRRCVPPLVVLCVSLACARVQADGGSRAASSQSGSQVSNKLNTDSTANVRQARAHFGRGVQYYEDMDYRAALLEFERAYALQHSYPLLYNLGQVSFELRDYAGAERYFRKYLADGGSAIPSERRAEILVELTRLKTRVGSLRINTNLSDVEIRLDDQLIELPKSGSLRVSAGRRQVVAEKSGYSPVRRVVDVLGGEELNVSLMFGPPEAQSSSQGASNVLPWVVGISSAVVLIGAGGVSYWAYRDSSDYKAELNRVTTRDKLERLSSQARGKALVADILFGTAVVGAAVTTILLLTGGPRETPPTATTKPGIQVGSSGVQLQF